VAGRCSAGVQAKVARRSTMVLMGCKPGSAERQGQVFNYDIQSIHLLLNT
jgi:hypothetical protein